MHAEGAFQSLDDAYAIDPNARGLQRLFESCLRLRISMVEDRKLKRGKEENAMMKLPCNFVKF